MASSSKSEQAYIRSSFLAKPPLRLDGRSLSNYRPIALETDVAPLANGSARVCIGGTSAAGTEVLAAVKLEVEDTLKGNGIEGGRVVCNVTCSPSAYPNLSSHAIDDMQADLTSTMQEFLVQPSLHPQNLTILPGKKSWLLHLDLLVLTDSGNIYDVLFITASAALRSTRVPRTRSIEFRAPRSAADKSGSSQVDASASVGGSDRMAVDDVRMGEEEPKSGFDTRVEKKTIADFELVDSWDEGEPLLLRSGAVAAGSAGAGVSISWPVCITLNMVPPIHYLDATSVEESATDLRLLLFFSFHGSTPRLHGMRLIGTGETDMSNLKSLLREGERCARELYGALDDQLRGEHERRKRHLHSPRKGG